MIGAVVVILVLLFMPFFVSVVLFSEKWTPLIAAIIFGDKSKLQDEILDSGICEHKRFGWKIKPKPKSDNPNPIDWQKIRGEEIRGEEIRGGDSRDHWDRGRIHSYRAAYELQGPDLTGRHGFRTRDELDDLADELLNEI